MAFVEFVLWKCALMMIDLSCEVERGVWSFFFKSHGWRMSLLLSLLSLLSWLSWWCSIGRFTVAVDVDDGGFVRPTNISIILKDYGATHTRSLVCRDRLERKLR